MADREIHPGVLEPLAWRHARAVLRGAYWSNLVGLPHTVGTSLKVGMIDGFGEFSRPHLS